MLRSKSKSFRRGLTLGLALTLALFVHAQDAPPASIDQPAQKATPVPQPPLPPACDTIDLTAPAGSPSRPPILLLHGLGNCPWEMRPIAEHLNKLGYTVHVPMIPGHGTKPEDLLSYSPKDYIDFISREVRNVARSSPSGKILVGGISFGGLLSYLASQEFPNQVSGVFMLAPFFGSRPESLLATGCGLSSIADFSVPVPGDGPKKLQWHFWYTEWSGRFLCTLKDLRDKAVDRTNGSTIPTMLVTSDADIVTSGDAARAAMVDRTIVTNIQYPASDKVQHLMSRKSDKTNPLWDLMMSRIDSFLAGITTQP